jgi:hypothetical protein
MPNLESNELPAYLDQIIAATQSRKMTWGRANPTTYTWSVPGKPGRIVLQSVDRQQRVVQGNVARMVMTKQYILQVFDNPQNQTPRLSIDGNQSPEINAKLGAIFEAISNGLMQSGLDFLKSLLPSE